MTLVNFCKQNQQEAVPYKILAIGTPIIDCLIPVSHNYLKTIPGFRGGSILVEHEKLQQILKDHQPLKRIAGGSSANTVKGLAQLGHDCSFFGKIGNDSAGKIFFQDIQDFGVLPHLPLGLLPTGQTACLITPDHERTMRTYIGAGEEMHANDLSTELFQNIQLVHIEGYLMNREGLVEKAMQLAKEAGATISFDISSFEIAAEYKRLIIYLLKRFVNIVFANEKEAQTLTGLSPEKACIFLKDFCDISVVKMGNNGAWAATQSNKIFQQALEVSVVDTTGAGDLFATGFLHGFLNHKTLEECLKMGAFIASKVIQVFGAEIPKTTWKNIKNSCSNFLNI